MVSVVENYEKTVINLLRKKAFFAKLIMTCKKDFSFPHPTAAVSIKSTGVTLHLNPEFFNALSESEREGILVHEILHLIHGHAMRFKNFNPMDQGLANVACDVAINQFIPELPKTMKVKNNEGKFVDASPVTYELLKKEIPDILPKMSSEYYFNHIKQEQQKRGKNGEGEGGSGYYIVDDHGEWEETDLTPEQIEKLVKGHVKAVLEGCNDKERECVDKTIIDELYKSEINWKQQLRNFFANSEETFTESTRKKRNRRYGIIHPGTKNEQKLKIGIPIDTSGSVTDEWLKMIFGEVDRIYDPDKMELWIMEADTKIQNCYKYEKGMKIEAEGRGGTMYNPAFKKCNELKVDAAIYCGDGDCADIPVKPRYPVLWGMVGKGNPPVTWGKVIRIE